MDREEGKMVRGSKIVWGGPESPEDKTNALNYSSDQNYLHVIKLKRKIAQNDHAFLMERFLFH